MRDRRWENRPVGYYGQRAAVVELLGDGGTFTPADLMDRIGLSESRARDILNDLTRTGEATKHEGRPARYERT